MPDTRYVQSRDGTYIAYQMLGEGAIDLVYVPTWASQVEHLWEEPRVAAFFHRLASFSRLIIFDRRGSGLSDPATATLEDQMDDVCAVMDAVDSERAGFFAQLEGGAMAALFAATYPERVGALALYAAWSRSSWAEDYPWALKPHERASGEVAERIEHWGSGGLAETFAPSLAGEARFRDWFAKMERLAASPGQIKEINVLIAATDVRHVLPSIRVPTLVLHRPGDTCIDIRHSEYLRDHIPGARLVELPGVDTMPFIEMEPLVEELQEFFTGARGRPEPDRVLATVMFTDIVGSTRHAAELGDARFRELLERHHELVRRQLDRYRGREVKTIGDGFLATFDGPARAVRAASAITESVRDLGIELRAGLHTGELEVIGSDVGGLAVHIGARVSELAGPGQVLVSSTVKDLVVGSGIEFAECGLEELRGVPGRWQLYEVTGHGS